MAVFRVERTRDYTVMCNHHLKDSNLSLKAKGLLSMMLSLPDEWNYTTRGLAAICKEGVDAIGKTLKELELAGYIIRRQLRGKDGRISDTEYTIFEKPRNPSPPDTTLPDTENPYLDNPDTEAPDTDNPAQLNTKKSNTQKSNTDLSSTHSFFLPAADGMTDGFEKKAEIREQIEYDILCQQYDRMQLDELVEIMLEVAMNRSPTVKIGRDAEYPTGFVQQRFEKITSMGPYYMAGQKMNNTIIEYINGMEVVKVFNKDADSYERFRKDVSDYRDYTLAWYKAAWPWMAIYSSLLPCTIILTLPVGAWFVLSGWSTLPNLILVLCLSLSIGMPLLKSLGFLPTMPQLNYKISALEQVLDAPELQQTEDAFHGKDDTITYDHVSFAYQTTQPGPDGKPVVIEDEVLHDISFTAKAGQKTALVGESGSGKSTLAKLLIHYYDPQKGSISIGGQKLCDMSLEALNSRISYVAQDQYLFNTSLLENIRLGRLNATDEEVVEAAKKAQCMEFLEKLPQGIHSMAGDAGKMLSGGQRQRISLARAILKDAPIVVLDEATAYADPENEEKMEAAITELVKGKTLVVIAHKLPAIMNADQICVMDHGKLVATGRHQELIQSCPEYQKLWKAAQDSAEWKVHTAKEGK